MIKHDLRRTAPGREQGGLYGLSLAYLGVLVMEGLITRLAQVQQVVYQRRQQVGIDAPLSIAIPVFPSEDTRATGSD